MAARRRPSALKHGLTSHYARAEWSGDVVSLADAILGSASREWRLLETAREAAEAILYLRRIRQCRLQVMEGGTLGRVSRSDEEKALALQLSDAVKVANVPECQAISEKLRVVHQAERLVDVETTATFILGEEIDGHSQDLRRLGEYERRAISRHRKTLRRLDYEMTEAERRAPRSS